MATREVALRLGGVRVSTISRWVKDGKLTPLHRLPGATGAMVFARDEVEAFARGLAEWEADRLRQIEDAIGEPIEAAG